MRVAVMITTRNRAADLRRTLAVLGNLHTRPSEILITADGCSDETVDLILSEYPDVRLFVNESCKGSVASRDNMMREANGDLILAIDDDSYPEQSDCLERIITHFERNSKLAVLHFPQRTDEYPETISQNDFLPEHPTRSFANSGAVLRRSTYLKLQGFETSFIHMYEEPDYALQCVAAGYEVIYSPIVTIRHHYSGQARSELRNHHRHARNEFWSTMMRCPFPQLILMVLWRGYSQARFAAGRGFGWLICEPVWWGESIRGIPTALKRRKPVSWAGYKKWLSLS